MLAGGLAGHLSASFSNHCYAYLLRAAAMLTCTCAVSIHAANPIHDCVLSVLPACRKYAWGSDEVDIINHTPKAWFNLGLTIVDSLDTLILAGARCPAARRTDGCTVCQLLSLRNGCGAGYCSQAAPLAAATATTGCVSSSDCPASMWQAGAPQRQAAGSAWLPVTLTTGYWRPKPERDLIACTATHPCLALPCCACRLE
jgi:hypothetical protein